MEGNRVAIVTGGNRGIGHGISVRLAGANMDIAIIYYRRKEEADRVVDELREMGRKATAYQADVSRPDEVAHTITAVGNTFGRIDVLVNNAGLASKSSTLDLDEEMWDRVIDVNLKGTYLCSQAVIPFMQYAAYGRIINLTSIAGQTGGGIGPHYAASKAGVIGLTRFMATELGPHGITVNAISPSGVPTDLLLDLGMQPSAQRPVRRVGTTDDIAAAAAYLASESAGYITGQVLSV
ncbi:MAG TPA: SDR family oxidoreductase, partial [Promineifilum sp.]|nr:SDR family oxidoreductase [Promineifilum sp.]